ncbi:lysophospholipid acyltransferase family protein [Pedobacter sp. AW1-32]|uniref:lysophospholipid acyltransferase family protein n=1 Tax=Pedobacter sp. AW1-32 TaxID=3383026 RepID=UPI003FEF878C
MYHPRQNSFIFSFFSWYISFILKRDFKALHFNRIDVDQKAGLLVLANHFSWWDGFILFQLNKLSFRKHFHILVNTENYQNVGFLKYLGAFAPQSKGKDILKTIEYAAALLSNPNNMVVIFPQGKLKSNHQAEIVFEQGVAKIIEKCAIKPQTLFIANFIDYFSNRKPSIYSYLSTEHSAYLNLRILNAAYNKHYQQSLVTQNQLIK